MRLTKVEAKGFKSFAARVSLSFSGGVVGIVGPNGSGKSNINDAIKWVLGERSIKSLRGATSDDIIFSGSKSAQPATRAEVSLTFDNSEGKIANVGPVLRLTRMIERGSGESVYLINDEPAKLREIEEIAMQTGISKSSLAIISQGTIQNIAQASPEERRALFEDAAGIAIWKARRAENARKLERVTEALEKVRAVINELNRQLAPLERQAAKARLFLTKKAELKAVEIALLVEDMSFFNAQLKTLNAELANVLEERASLESRINTTEQTLQENARRKLAIEQETSALNISLQQSSATLARADIAAAEAAQRRQLIINEQLNASPQVRLAAMREELTALTKRLSDFSATSGALEANLTISQTSERELAKALSDLQLQNTNAQQTLANTRLRLSILQEQEASRTNLFQGPRTVMANQSLFSGVQGLVGDLLVVPSFLASAIEAVLGASLQNVVTKSAETAVKAVEYLKANRGGRATFVPLDSIKPRGIIDEHISVIKAQLGVVGIASELVSAKVEHDALKKFLLGNIIVAEDINSATSISRIMRQQYLVVSLDGDLVRPGGTITGGERLASREVFSLRAEIEQLTTKLVQLEQSATQTQAPLTKAQQAVQESQLLVTQLSIELARINEQKTLVNEQFFKLRAEYDAASATKFDLVPEVKAISAQEIMAQQVAMRASLTAKQNALNALNNLIAADTIAKTELERSLRLLIDTSAQQLTAKNQADYVLNASRTRLAEEYELTFEAAQADYVLDRDRDEARTFVAKVKQEIKDLGNVNVDAIAAYEETKVKHEELAARESEVFNAQQIIVAAISEIDQVTIMKMDEIVRAVNVAIAAIFQKMFGGGHAEVVYSNPRDLLQSGIDIVAQPPGKTIKNINLFSGGEKALVAISLLFAILKSRPIPLCILDEVEAALDEANVIRFANYLQELKGQTQFMIITHRPQTMSRVDELFGVTMQTKGVTSLVSVKLTEAASLLTTKETH